MSEEEPDQMPDAGEKTRVEHQQYFFAVHNPVRRQILEALKENSLTVEKLCAITGLNEQGLCWHLSVLEAAKCIQKASCEGNAAYCLTKQGKVVEYL
jgi:DNA-binding transcriptional ArsR family regulator